VDNRKASEAVYVLKLRARPGDDGIRNLRALLKVALRRFDLRCVSITQEAAEQTERAA